MGTPGFLRSNAVGMIIGIMHSAHEHGPWAVESVVTEIAYDDKVSTRIEFRVGFLPSDFDIRTPDPRETVTITIEQGDGS